MRKRLNIKVLISVLVVIIFIALACMPAVDSSASGTAQANNIPYAVDNNSSIASQFASWYSKAYPNSSPLQVANMNTSQRDAVFGEFLHSDIAAQKLISERNNNSIAKFNTIDHERAAAAFNSIMNNGAPTGYRMELQSKNGSTVTSLYVHSGTVTSAIVHIRPDLPNGVSDHGEWVMVSINYFVYHAPWWLGGWSVTYGEHDVINSLYAGNSAQRYYNHITSETNDHSILISIALYALSAGLAFAPASFGLSGLAGAIVAAAVGGAGIVIDVLAVVWDDDFTSLYESTYANEPAGNKSIWVYDTIDYYYPWVTVVGTLASSIGMYGYLSNMHVVTFIPNVPVVAYGSMTGLYVVSHLSSYTHKIANQIGCNTWGYGGSYSG